PEHVVSGAHFDSWWKKARRHRPERLHFGRDLLVRPGADDVDETAFPDSWTSGGPAMPLSYVFAPGKSTDGLTIDVPLIQLAGLDPAAFEWQVPGHRLELVTELIRSLPKPLRRHFVPAPDHARTVLQRMSADEPSLLVALGRELGRISGVPVPRDAWRMDRLPAHLRLTFRVVDDEGAALAEGTDIADLQRRLRPRTEARLTRAATGLERHGLTEWSFGELPRTFETEHDGHPVSGFPALVDEGSSAGVAVLHSEEEQLHSMRAGTRRLLLLAVVSPLPVVVRRLDNRAKLALGGYPYGGIGRLLDDCLAASVDALVARHGGPAWDEAGFERLRELVRGDLHDMFESVLQQVHRVLDEWQAVGSSLDRLRDTALAELVDDVRAQLDHLLAAGFVTRAGADRMPHLVRYLRAVEYRLERAPQALARDRAAMDTVHSLEDRLQELREAASRDVDRARLEEVGWMIEELRVSFFAQHLGTAHSVSEKRVRRALETE
ncbi:MAG: DUF3418 domain-containing protein, partial [Thermocrispum sp.]